MMATNDITLSATQKTTRFNPTEHLTDLKGKKYLEAKWRLMWFRDDHPMGKVVTELVSSDTLLFKATVLTAEGEVLATGHGSATAKPGSVWSGREVEKAETAAISRALGHAGYGTQFTEDEDLNHLADSPVQRKQPQSERQPSTVRGAGIPRNPAPVEVAGLIAVLNSALAEKLVKSKAQFDGIVFQLKADSAITDETADADVLEAIRVYQAAQDLKKEGVQ